MLIPVIVIGALTAGSIYAVKKRSKKSEISGITPQRQKLHEALLMHQIDPKKLRKMASVFEGEGLSDEATKLRRKAAIIELPKEKKDERRQIFKKAMSSTNRDAVMSVATIFENDGCIGAAADLRQYARGLPPN